MRQRVAEAFHPGEFVREEMEARGWSQVDLAEILGRPPRLVSELLAGTRSVSTETANGLAEAFGTDAQLWMNLQTSYDLWKSESDTSGVSRRARLYSYAPLRDMISRGWIERSESIDVLERRVCDFFGVKSIEERPAIRWAAKTSIDETPSQTAWVFRALALARTVPVGAAFTEARLDKCIDALRALAGEPHEARHVQRVLADAGIRFVVVEPLPKTRIDGACLWLDSQSPVVALSFRYDRIDSFWHTLLHELGHVKHRHVDLDIDLGKNARDDENERQANDYASEKLIPRASLADFIARVRPLYSQAKIVGFARTIGVHPGIVVGQLQFRREIGYAHSRSLLCKIRQYVIGSTLTDGWGSIVPADL